MSTAAVGGARRGLTVAAGLVMLVASMLVTPAAALADGPPALAPIDPQVVTQPDQQTWADYKPIPGSAYADNSIEPSIQRWNVAIIMTDFPGTPFSITLPQGSTVFGTPSSIAHDVPRAAVPAFYQDWLNSPMAMNNYQGMNRYWMEDTFGKYGVDLQAYGPYLLPRTQDEYFLGEYAGSSLCNTQTRTTTAQSGVLDVEVVSTASFSVGKRLSGLSGTRVVTEIPDATHLRTGAATTLAAAAVAGTTNIKVSSVTGLTVGDTLDIGFDDRLETVTITAVGTQGSSGSGVDFDPALTFDHARSTIVNDMTPSAINVSADSFVHSCSGNSFRTDVGIAWEDHVSAAERATYDNYFYVGAGQDETSTWQEFGEMMFTQYTVPDEFGPPNPEIPQNWANTRYIDWTSWVSAATIWPSASGRNSIEGEGSGMAVYAHELSHNLGIGDNYGNPYAPPFQRPATGYWNMMSRGSFNGPGGTHTRWYLPGDGGSSLGSQHVMLDKIYRLSAVDDANFVNLNRNGLEDSGLAVVDVSAREADPGADGQSSVQIVLDGASPVDHSLSCSVFTTALADAASAGDTNIKVDSVTNIAAGRDIVVGDPGNDEVAIVDSVGSAGAGGTGVTLTAPLTLSHANGEAVSNRLTCSGSANKQRYMVEVIQQIGSDSFQADSGVMISKNRGTSSTWTIDADPTDINLVDFVRPQPDGTTQMVTTGDPRQLTDALFHAGTNSGSQYEWEDTLNGLHFYIVDRYLDGDGVLHYKVAVQNINGSGDHTRGVAVGDAPAPSLDGSFTYCNFPLTNTGEFVDIGSPHPDSDAAIFSNDVYRLSALASGNGWAAQLPNELAAAAFGETVSVPVYVTRTAGASTVGLVSLTATSVSDSTKTASANCLIWPDATGFLPPVSQDGVNAAKAGSAVPIRFDLGGNFGVDIIAAGYPVSQQVDCATLEALGPEQQTLATQSQSFQAGKYTYIWKTDKAWAGTCRVFTLKLIEDSFQTPTLFGTATFKFK